MLLNSRCCSKYQGSGCRGRISTFDVKIIPLEFFRLQPILHRPPQISLLTFHLNSFCLPSTSTLSARLSPQLPLLTFHLNCLYSPPTSTLTAQLPPELPLLTFHLNSHSSLPTSTVTSHLNSDCWLQAPHPGMYLVCLCVCVCVCFNLFEYMIGHKLDGLVCLVLCVCVYVCVCVCFNLFEYMIDTN